jgi:hypothetical protein
MSIEAAGYNFTAQAANVPNPLAGLRPINLNYTPLQFSSLSAPQVFDDRSELIHSGITQGLGSIVEGVKTSFISDRENKAALAKEERDYTNKLQLETLKSNRATVLNKQRLDAIRQSTLDRIRETGGDKTPMRYVDEDYSGGDIEGADEDAYYGENTPNAPYVDDVPTGEQEGEQVYPDRIEPALPPGEEEYNRDRELNDENTVPTEDQNIPAVDLDFEPLPELSRQAEPFSGPSLFSNMDLSAIDPRYLSAQAGGAGAPPAPEIPLSSKLAPLDFALTQSPVAATFVPPAAEQALRKEQQALRRAATRAAVEQEAAALAGMQEPVLAARAEPAPVAAPEAPKQKGFHPDFKAGAYRSLKNAQAAADLPVPEGFLPPTVELKRNKDNEEYYEVGVPQRATKAKEAAAFDAEGEERLRKEYANAQQTKEYVTVQAAWRNIQKAARLAETGNPAAGDLAMIFSFMKLLDPNSVVREQEFANAQNAAGVPDRIRALYNNVKSGGRLAEQQRKEFVTVGKGIFQSRQESQNNMEEQYRELARNIGLRPEAVVINLRTPDPESDLQDEFNSVASQIVDLDQASQEYKDGLNKLTEIRKKQRELKKRGMQQQQLTQ